MLSCREAEHGEEHEHDEREHSPAPAHGGRVGPPQLFGEQHDGHEKAGVSAEDQAHITGVMGTLWGEAIRDINRATYMAYPRAFALAEAGWTQMKYRNWESFKQRLYPNLTNLMKKGVSVRVPFEIVDRK